MERIWQFTARDRFGKVREYQHRGPDVSEAATLEHLRKHYHGCDILNLREIEPRKMLPAKGPIAAHIFDYGILRRLQSQKLVTTVTVGELRETIIRYPIRSSGAAPLSAQPIRNRSITNSQRR